MRNRILINLCDEVKEIEEFNKNCKDICEKHEQHSQAWCETCKELV